MKQNQDQLINEFNNIQYERLKQIDVLYGELKNLGFGYL